MAFDPDQFLSSSAATAQVATPAAQSAASTTFNPDVFLSSGSPKTQTGNFDPNSFLNSQATPQERLAAFAPLAASPNATAQDDAAYKKAYVDYYMQNSVGQRIGRTLSDLHPSQWPGALWNMVKGIGSWSQQAANPQNASASDWYKGILTGASTGLKETVRQVPNMAIYGMEQLADIVGRAENNPKELEYAAASSLNRLKMNAQAEAQAQAQQNTLSPSAQAAYQLGRFGGQSIPFLATGAVKPIEQGGAVVENAATRFAGLGALAAPPIIKTAEAGAIGTALLEHPVIGSAIGMAAKIGQMRGLATGDTSWINPYNLIRHSVAEQSGMFQFLREAGGRMVTTPIGKGFIDDLANTGDTLLSDAFAKNQQLRTMASDTAQALTDAKKLGLPTAQYTKSVAAAQKAEKIGDVYSGLMEKGVNVAQWLQAHGMSGIPRDVANAVSGAIQGGIFGSAMQAANQVPGQSTSPGSNQGAAYGMILSLLGSAGAASESAARKAPIDQPSVTINGVKHFLKPGYYGRAGFTPQELVDAYYGRPQIFSAEPTPETVNIGGVPHDARAFTGILENATKAAAQAERENGPETFKIPLEIVKNRITQNAVSERPSDQLLRKLAASSEKAPSGAVGMWSYDEPEQTALLQFFEEGKGQQFYAVTEMPPQAWQNWQHADSVGEFFNRYVRRLYPVFRLGEYLGKKLEWGPREPTRPSNIGPSPQLLKENKGEYPIVSGQQPEP